MYLALARKYRPQKFKDLIGQPHITKTLQNAIKMNKIYPALIFSGMKGVGKTSAARILAKSLNCEKGPAIEPCNKCQICIEITEDKSPDYIEIDGASNNGVEEVRNLRERVKYKPFKNRFKIIVIDEVHMLSSSAWNALLKTIEEPPEYTYFIMATTDFHKIPATIVSRCQHFEFKRIPYEIIITLLKEISQKENINISEYSLYLIARSSEGSLRDAKKILDQSIALSSGDVKDKDVVEILGIVEEEIFIKLTRSIFEQDRKEIIELINSLSERGLDLRFFLNEFLKFFRDLIVFKSINKAEKFSNLNPENIPEIKEILKNVREVELLRYFNAAKDLEITMRYTENPRIILEYLFLKLSYFPSLISIEELIKGIKVNKISTINRSVQEYNIEGEEVNDKDKIKKKGGEGISVDKIESEDPAEKIHSVLIKKLEKENPRLASALNPSSFYFKNNILIVEFPSNLEHAYVIVKENIEYLKEIFNTVVKKRIEIEVSISKKYKKKDEQSRIKELKKDKMINNLVDKIKGRIISIESNTGGTDG